MHRSCMHDDMQMKKIRFIIKVDWKISEISNRYIETCEGNVFFAWHTNNNDEKIIKIWLQPRFKKWK